MYAGLLVLQERGSDNRPRVTYTRGPDLSGGLDQAGGIGGLIAMSRHNASGTDHFYYHGDGSGNVTALLDARNNVVARYRYDPFGNIQGLAGPLAEANRMRFSSKEFHLPSGLSYFGFRYYDPHLQRWINQDPIEENGGIGLYTYVGNAPTTAVDPDGQFWDTIWDVGNILYDAGKIAYGYVTESSLLIEEGQGDLVLDAAAALIPFVPAGATKALRGAGKMAKYLDNAAAKADDALCSARRNADIACDAGKSASEKSLTRFYPANDGFGSIPESTFLMPGQIIDRYGGSGYSRFFSPAGTPAWARSLPPQTMRQPLRSFQVIKPFEVRAGSVAPWFNQPGGSLQYLSPVRLELLLKHSIIKEIAL